jgi:hypothetical protein
MPDENCTIFPWPGCQPPNPSLTILHHEPGISSPPIHSTMVATYILTYTHTDRHTDINPLISVQVHVWGSNQYCLYKKETNRDWHMSRQTNSLAECTRLYFHQSVWYASALTCRWGKVHLLQWLVKLAAVSPHWYPPYCWRWPRYGEIYMSR